MRAGDIGGELRLHATCSDATECHRIFVGRFNYPRDGASRILHESGRTGRPHTASNPCSAIGFLIV